MFKYFVMGSLVFTTFCAGIGFLTYQKVIKMDLSTPVSDLQSNAEFRIELLEKGLATQNLALDRCRDTIGKNKVAFERYVERNSDFVSKANDEIAFIEGKVLQTNKATERALASNKKLQEALTERDAIITRLNQYIQEMQNEETKR